MGTWRPAPLALQGAGCLEENVTSLPVNGGSLGGSDDYVTVAAPAGTELTNVYTIDPADTTKGSVTVDLKAGQYRATVVPAHGFSGSTSVVVRLKR